MKARSAALPRPLAMQLARTEYERCAELFRSLSDSEWTADTDCPGWDVRQMASHMLGMAEMAASVRETLRQQRRAKQAGGDPLNALTALQVAKREDWTPQQIVDRFSRRAPTAVAGRRRTPRFVRKLTVPDLQAVNGTLEPWRFGYLIDIIFTRDPWMHRIDISYATGKPPHLTADHDGVIVADIVAEWANRHGKDFTLLLTGPAGGTWQTGVNGPSLTFDAIDFCRALSLRPGTIAIDDLLSTAVPY